MGGRHARLGADKANKLVFVRAKLKLLANDYTKRPFIAWDPDSVESDGFLGSGEGEDDPDSEESDFECVCVFSSHPFWTSSSLDVPAGVTQEEGHTGFLIHLPSAVRALIFVARRIQPFLSLVDREVEFCVLTN